MDVDVGVNVLVLCYCSRLLDLPDGPNEKYPRDYGDGAHVPASLEP